MLKNVKHEKELMLKDKELMLKDKEIMLKDAEIVKERHEKDLL